MTVSFLRLPIMKHLILTVISITFLTKRERWRLQLQPGEGENLRKERTRLTNAEQLAALADEAYSYLDTQTDELPAIRDLLGHTARALAGLAKIDASQASLCKAAEQLSFQADDLANAVRDYREQIEFNPGRLAAVEERTELIRSLQRKYGDSIEDVQTYADWAMAELEMELALHPDHELARQTAAQIRDRHGPEEQGGQ